jgi:hypothetical protein
MGSPCGNEDHLIVAPELMFGIVKSQLKRAVQHTASGLFCARSMLLPFLFFRTKKATRTEVLMAFFVAAFATMRCSVSGRDHRSGACCLPGAARDYHWHHLHRRRQHYAVWPMSMS